MKKHQRSFFVAGFVSIVILVSIILSGCPDGGLPQSLDLSVTLTVSDNTNGTLVKEVSFNSAEKTASVNVANELEAVDIGIEKDIAGASVTVNGQVLTVDNDVSIELDIGSNTVTVVVTSEDGTAVTYILTITRLSESDSNPPVITLTGDNPFYVEVGSTYTDPGCSASDAEEGDLTSAVVVSGLEDLNVNKLGNYILTYNVSDSSGNAAETVTRTVVVQDTTIPVIVLNGDAEINVYQGVNYTDAGAVLTDNYDADKNILATGSVDTSEIGQYILTYNGTDSSGNAAETVTRTIHVVDFVACELPRLYFFDNVFRVPTDWTLMEFFDSSLTVQSSFEPPLMEISIFEIDNDLKELILGVNVPGGMVFIKLKWSDVDANDHTSVSFYSFMDSVSAARESTEITSVCEGYINEAKVPPVIKLNGDDTVVVAVGGVYTEAGAVALDWEESPDVQIDSSEVDTSTAGTYSVKYNCTDKDGNTALEVTRTVVVGSGAVEIIVQ